MRALHVAALLLVGCGRIAFDPIDGDGDGGTTNGDACTPGTGPVLEYVQKGTLVIDAASLAANVGLPQAAPSDRTILFFSLRESEPSPPFGAVGCQLVNDNVNCARPQMGTDTGLGVITVHWAAVTFASGVSVQRGLAMGPPAPITINAVDLASSFVVLGGCASSLGGTVWGTDEYVRAQLASPTTLDMRKFSTAPMDQYWQVVTMTGARVTRGSSMLAGDQTALSVPTSAPGFPLISYVADTTNANGASATSLSARIVPGAIELARESVFGIPLDVSWELVSLPFFSQPGFATLSGASTSLPTSAFGDSTTIAVAHAQGLFGQSSGTTTHPSDLVGEAAFTLDVATGVVTIARASTTSSATVFFTVIDFAQPVCQ